MFTPAEDIPQIVQSLRKTFQQGSTKNDIEFRRKQLLNLRRFLIEKQEDIVQVLLKDLHKHRVEVIAAEISPVMGEIDYMLENLDTFTKTKVVKPNFLVSSSAKCTVRKEPKGVVLIIGAWNYPIHLILYPLVGAIAAGNCAVIKPSEVSVHTAELLGKYLPQYLDQDAFTTVLGGVKETTALLEQRFDHIFYTGSGQVGKIVMAAASKHLTSVTLELGGKSPVVIAPDADLRVAARRVIWGKTFNSGQTCVAPDYVMLSKSQLNEFVDHCKKTIEEFFGPNPKESGSYCRLVNERRFDQLQKLLESVDRDQIVVGGETDRNQLYIAPTIVAPVKARGVPLMSEEIFGPILPIVCIDSIDEAIDVINSNDAPLAIYIFSTDKAVTDKILNNTQSGPVVINDVLVQVLESSMPFGGAGPSGIGAYHGEKSFDAFTHERSTMIQIAGLEGAMGVRYPPYTQSKSVLFLALAGGLGSGLKNKVAGLFQVFSATFKYLSGKAEPVPLAAFESKKSI